MATDNYNLEQKAENLLNIIKKYFLTSDGFLAREFPPGKKTLFDNFDDLVPFFLYFNQEDFLLSQVRKISEKQEDMLSLCSENNVLVTRTIDEWFGGLFAIWQVTKDPIVYKLLTDSVFFVRKNLMLGSDYLNAALYLKKNKGVNFYEPWSAGLLECFCEMKELYPEMFLFSQNVMRSWIVHPYFQKFGLFPYRIFSSPTISFLQEHVFSFFNFITLIPKPISLANIEKKWKSPDKILKIVAKKFLFYLQNGWSSQLMKSNSTPAFTMLEFYVATKDTFWRDNLLKWIDSALENFCDANGRVFMFFNSITKKKIRPCATATFILADVICDAIYFADLSSEKKDYLLNKVKLILDHVWNGRLENGLIPFDENGKFSQIDNQVDFSVSLRRYGELANDDIYRQRAFWLTEKALNTHHTPEGYLTYVGAGVEKIIDPKYNCLVLKGLINLLTKEEKIYPKFYSLFKDR